MFVEPIVKRVENAMDATVARVSGSALALIPLLAAAGFATAAAAIYANERLGPERGNLLLAGVFLVVSLVTFGVVRRREARMKARARAELAAMTPVNSVEALLDGMNLSNLPQALMDAAKTAAPDIGKAALKELPRNLHLLVGAGVGLFLASRIVDALDKSRERRA